MTIPTISIDFAINGAGIEAVSVSPITAETTAPMMGEVVPRLPPSPEAVALFEKAMADNAVIAKEFETVVAEKPIISTKPAFTEAFLAAETTKVAEFVNPEALPVATPETFKAVVVENKEIAKVFEAVVAETPMIVEKPVVVIEKQIVAEKPQVVITETPKTSESSVNFVAKELPVATPETFKAVVVENKEVAKVFETVVREKPVVVSVEKPVVHIPVLATENTKVTETIVVANKPFVAGDEPVIIEKPDIQVPAEKPQVVVTEVPKAFEPFVNFEAKELPVATPETFKAVVVENKEVAKVFEAVVAEKPIVISEKPEVVSEKPVIVEKPMASTIEKPVVSDGAQNVVIAKPEALPVATPETFKAVVVENKEVANVFEAVVAEKPIVISEKPIVVNEKPVIVEKPMASTIEKPVVSDRAQNVVIAKPEALPVATPETFKAVIVENKEVAKAFEAVVTEKPQVVVTEMPKAFESSVNFVTKELPIATPETFKAVVVENKEVANVFEAVVAEKPVVISKKPVIVGESIVAEKPIIAEKPTAAEKPVTIVDNKMVVQVPVLATENTKVTETIVVNKPFVAGDEPVIVEKPDIQVPAEKPQVVVTEVPKAFEPFVNFVAKELPEATPETFKAVVVENKEVANVFEAVVAEKPMVISEKPVVQVPVLATENTKVTEATVVEKPVIAEKPIVAAKPKTVETSVNKEVPTPVVIDLTQLQPTAAPVKDVEVAPVAQVSASVVEQVERVSAASVLIEAATAVADTLVFNPGLVRGEGEIKVVLKENVLAGTEISMTIHNGELAIKFLPTVDAIASLLTSCQGELVQLLSTHVRNFKVTTSVVKKNDDETV